MEPVSTQQPSYDGLSEQIRRIEALLLPLADALLQFPSNDEILTFSEACGFLKIASGTLYKLTSQNQIPFFKAGKQLRFSKKALLEHLFYSQLKK